MQLALFRRFARLAHQEAGIALRDGKEALVEARVAGRIRALQLPDASAYIDYLEREGNGEERRRFLEVISTHFTGFFREADHFEELRAALAGWMAAGQTRFRLWSAAASTGEEPYSMAMTVLSAPGSERLDWKILATDIAADTLAVAERGHYSAERVAPVPPALRQRFLWPVPGPAGGGEDRFAVTDGVKAGTVFRRLNLARPPWAMTGPLDAVFVRNVLIYFDPPTRQRLLSAVERLLRPDGLLCIGHTETLSGPRSAFRMVRPSVFRKREGGR